MLAGNSSTYDSIRECECSRIHNKLPHFDWLKNWYDCAIAHYFVKVLSKAQIIFLSTVILLSFGGEAVLHRFSNPHHDWALFKQSQYEVWVPYYTISDISEDGSPRKSLTKKTFIVRTTINFLPTKEENVFRKRSSLYQSISISHTLSNQMQFDILTTGFSPRLGLSRYV
ncbi:hypothetical protein Trydic_g3524 [Trypoxylus dichotomus]